MIAILAYWLLLFFIFLPAGIFTAKHLHLKTESLPLHVILGMFATTVVFTCIAFLTKLNLFLFVTLCLAALALATAYRKHLLVQVYTFRPVITNLSGVEKIIIITLILSSALKSAQLPSLVDNDTYYIQTIKWVNEYGFIKGLANLHLFLGQMSPWHMLQAGTGVFGLNDLNGFLFVVCLLYYFTQNRSETNGWLRFLPMLSLLFFFFIDSPSPDLPLLMVTPIMLHLYLQNNRRMAWLMFLFMIYIKVTIAPLGLIFFYAALCKKKQLLFITASGLAVAFIWIIKNIIITGYPLYPLTLLPTGVDWQVPEHLLKGVHESSNQYIYGTADTSFFTKINSWLMMPRIDGLFNKLAVMLFLTIPLFRKIRQDRRFTVIYIAMLVQFIILLFTSPQFRFFLPTLVFFLAFVGHELFAMLKIRHKLYKVVLSASVIIVMLFSLQKTQWTQLYRPENNSAYDKGFNQETEGNLKFYTPQETFSFYGTSNGPLPCVNKAQLNHFKNKYRVVPQLRGETLHEGFYSANTND